MKFTKSFILAACLVLAASFQALAGQGFSAFSAPGTALGTGTNYVIIPPYSVTGGEPQINYLNVSGFSTPSTPTLTEFISTNQAVVVSNNVTTTVIINTNGFAPGQYVVIQHLSLGIDPRFMNEMGVIQSMGTSNQIVLQVAPLSTVAVGDIVNQETSSGTIPLASSATTPTQILGNSFIGQRREPFLITCTSSGVGTNTINTASANYLP